MIKPLGLYVHIPFCIQKCNYCDFTSFVRDEKEYEHYGDLLIKEIDGLKDYAKDYYLTTIFFGGGTPSLMPSKVMEKIMNKIKVSFFVDDNCEISFEANPKTVQLRKLKEYKSFGFNRISMGVQSLNDGLLKKIGRAHNVKDFFESYAAARLAGFENINLDIMFALPDQKLKDVKETVEGIIKFEPDSISAYSLIIEEGTPLYKNQNNFSFADDEENRRMYYFINDTLKENGYERYEISNFAKKGFECKHNLKYWEMEPYLGVGVAASSFFENVRYENPKNLLEYESFVENFKPGFTEKNSLSKKEMMSEFMFLGLRKAKGVDDNDFMKKYLESFFDVYKEEIEKHINNGLLIKDKSRIYLSDRGLDLANYVMSDFV